MKEPFLHNWMAQLRKGVLELCILNALRTGPKHGYEIVGALREVHGLMVAEATVYRVLDRLRREGYIAAEIEKSRLGPPRKCHCLTAVGETQLRTMNRHWAAMSDRIADICGPGT